MKTLPDCWHLNWKGKQKAAVINVVCLLISQLSLPTSRTGADWAKSCRHRRNQRKHFCERSNNAGAGNYDAPAPASDYIRLALTKISWMAQASGWSVFALAFIFVSNSIQNPGPAPTFSPINQAAHITRVPPCGGKKTQIFCLSIVFNCRLRPKIVAFFGQQLSCWNPIGLAAPGLPGSSARLCCQPWSCTTASAAPFFQTLFLILIHERYCCVFFKRWNLFSNVALWWILANLTEKDAVYHLPASVAATEVHLTITIPSFPTFSTSRCTYRLHFYHFQLFDSANAFNTSGRCRSSDVLIARQKKIFLFKPGPKNSRKVQLWWQINGFFSTR